MIQYNSPNPYNAPITYNGVGEGRTGTVFAGGVAYHGLREFEEEEARRMERINKRRQQAALNRQLIEATALAIMTIMGD